MTKVVCSFGLLVLCAFALLALFTLNGTQVDTTFSHAAERHGEVTADKIRECLNRQGIYAKWINPMNGHNIDVCRFESGLFALYIYRWVNGKVQEITAFPKEKYSTWQQVERYLRNSGAQPRNPALPFEGFKP